MSFLNMSEVLNTILKTAWLINYFKERYKGILIVTIVTIIEFVFRISCITEICLTKTTSPKQVEILKIS